MVSAKNKNDGSLPKSVVNEIGEHTPGGFIIFYFNSESGAPDNHHSFDTPAHCLALQKYIADWSKAVSEATIEVAKNNIKRGLSDEEQE